MSKSPIQTTILATSTVAAALLTIAALGFSTPTGENSKLLYNGNYWCVSNWIEEEDANGNRVYLPDPDGRGAMDHRLKGKESWLRLDQVEADTKEEAEQKATRAGLFEASEKVALREALDKSDIAFFTSHFNSGATHPGPCVGTGMGTGLIGMWINDSIRRDCFDIEPPTAATQEEQTDEVTGEVTQTSCGPTVDSLIPGVSMYAKGGKIGREEHLPTPNHYIGPDSKPTAFAAGGGAGAFAPHTTEQERWYITSQWPYARFTTSGVLAIPGSKARLIRQKIAHSRLVIKSVETGKMMVVSVEEAGPAGFVSARHGVNYGGPPEVYHYLGFKSEPYDNNPRSNNGRIEVLGFAKDQSTKLGPCK